MIILITGISSGFGLAMARRLSDDGHIVYGTVRREVEQLPGVHYLKADVRNEADARAAAKSVVDAEGRIDVLINNAGMGVGGPAEFIPEDDIRLQMDTNFMGQVHFCKAVLPYMRSQRSGKILCFSSIGGVMGLPFQAYYSASKFAVEGFAEGLQIETANMGIKIVLIEPGDFATGFTSARRKSLPEEALEAYPKVLDSVRSFENDERSGLKPEYLAGLISRIVVCKNPKFRYRIATFIQKLSLPLKVILPGRTFSRMIGWFYKQ